MSKSASLKTLRGILTELKVFLTFFIAGYQARSGKGNSPFGNFSGNDSAYARNASKESIFSASSSLNCISICNFCSNGISSQYRASKERDNVLLRTCGRNSACIHGHESSMSRDILQVFWNSTFIDILSSVRDYCQSWEGMLILERVASILISLCTLGDTSRASFFAARGASALTLVVDLICSTFRKGEPEPILRGNFDISSDCWCQLARRICSLAVEAGMSEKLSSRAHVRALHAGGTFDAFCRLLGTVVLKEGALHLPFAGNLIITVHALLAGEREYQRSVLNMPGILTSLVQELFSLWVRSWSGPQILRWMKMVSMHISAFVKATSARRNAFAILQKLRTEITFACRYCSPH